MLPTCVSPSWPSTTTAFWLDIEAISALPNLCSATITHMNSDIAKHVAACEQCQRNKPASGKPQGLLQPLPIPEHPWESVSFDFIVGLPPTEPGYNAIVVFVDRLTKMVHLAPCTESVTAPAVADLFFNHVVKLHGVPKSLVSDRGSQFTSKCSDHMCRLLDVTRLMSSSYHPETDGQTERMNRILGDMLRSYVDQRPVSWYTFLAPAEFAINNAVNRSIGTSPFYLNYGRHPTTPTMLELPDSV